MLMAYDSHGFGGEHDVAINVVDTAPPVLETHDVCVFPPNHKQVCLQLFSDLPVSASDVCTGDASEAVRIVDVTTNNADALLSWNNGEVCIDASRVGQGATKLTAMVQATDDNGNSVQRPLVITVPHDMRGNRNCLSPRSLQSAAGGVH